MSRGDSLARQLQLMQILDSRREIRVSEVAQELGWTQRTVYRDLLVLERVGVPIYQERDAKRARWRVVEGYSRRLSLTLSWAELYAMAVGTQLLGGVAGGAFLPVAESALGKLHQALPKEVVGRARDAGRHFTTKVVPEPARTLAHDMLDVLVGALERAESVRLTYRKPGSKTAEVRVVDPHHLHFQAGAIYLIGWCHARRGMRTFLLDRASAAAATGQRFARRLDFQLAAFLQGAFGPWEGKPESVVLRFERQVATFVAERRLHSSEKLQWLDDGSLELSIRVPVGPPLLSWVLGWGAAVRVLKPARLAKMRRDELARALKDA